MDVRELRAWLHRTTPDEREAAAAAIGTTVPYLYQLAGRHRRAGIEMAKAIEREIGVPRHSLRPDIWA